MGQDFTGSAETDQSSAYDTEVGIVLASRKSVVCDGFIWRAKGFSTVRDCARIAAPTPKKPRGSVFQLAVNPCSGVAALSQARLIGLQTLAIPSCATHSEWGNLPLYRS